MSTSISTVNTELTEECSLLVQYGIRATMIVLLFSLLSSIFIKLCNASKDEYKPVCSKCHKRQCKHSSEYFTNLNSKLQSEINYDLKNSYESEYRQKYLNESQYDKAMLTSPDNNFITGEAVRYIDKDNYRIEIFANLYLLNGNVYKAETSKGFYTAYLSNPSSTQTMLLGNLTKDRDHVYKLTVKSNTQLESVKNNKHIHIVYHENGQSVTILRGKFI